MFSVIYRFTIKENFGETFVAEWNEGTKEVIKNHGSLGARLHMQEDGSYIAYAQWPSKEKWQEFEASHDPVIFASMKECCLAVEVVMKLDVLSDLLVN